MCTRLLYTHFSHSLPFLPDFCFFRLQWRSLEKHSAEFTRVTQMHLLANANEPFRVRHWLLVVNASHVAFLEASNRAGVYAQNVQHTLSRVS